LAHKTARTVRPVTAIRQGEHLEENISARQSQTQTNPWISGTHEHQVRSGRVEAAPQKRPQGAERLINVLFRPVFVHTMREHTLRPRERLRKRQQFLDVFTTGLRKESRNFKCILRKNGSPRQRLGLTVGKRAGNAVTRNRIKRLLREFFRRNKDRLPASIDIVMCAKAGAAKLDYEGVCRELSDVLISAACSGSAATDAHKQSSQLSQAVES
jgi:ribonuclease P protein component